MSFIKNSIFGTFRDPWNLQLNLRLIQTCDCPSLLCDEVSKFKNRGLSNNIGNWSKWAWPCCRQEGGLARTVKRLCCSTDPPLPHQAHHPWAFQTIFGRAPFFLTSDHLTFFTVQLLYPCIFLTATRPLALGS